jgi:PAS domain S-box-containing protein
MVIDPTSHRLVDVNPFAEKLLGHSTSEITTLEVEDIFPDGSQHLVAALGSHRTNSDAAAHLIRSRCITSDNSFIDVEITGASLMFQGKRHYLIFVRDVTDYVKTREQLYHMQKMEAVGQLAGGIAHDFNNILTAVVGYASILPHYASDQELMRQNVDNILRLAERGAQLTKGLLAYSRKENLNPRLLNLNTLLQNTVQLLERMVPKKIKIKCLPAVTDLWIIADAGQMEQVLMNLTTNARDAMPNGGALIFETGCIEITDPCASWGHPAGTYALLTVTDTGTGMSETTKDKLFDPFFTTKEVGKGTGLGLSIVYGLVKAHKGFINVASEIGVGSAFNIYIPLVERGDRPEKKIGKAADTDSSSISLALQ